MTIAALKRFTLPLALFLAGCTTANHAPVIAMPATTTGYHGSVHGGQQPITGATINIYAVGTTGDGSAATSVLAAPLTTDSSGFFDLTNKVTCPTPTSLLYLVATGGNPGLAPPFSGAQISLITALGQCSNPSNIQFINVNEVTTVAAIYTLAPYMIDLTHIGSGPTDAASLNNAFTLAWELANITSGSSPGVDIPNGVVIPTAQINTLANLLSACVNSAGGTAGDSSFCGQLFTLLTPANTAPSDTAMALLNLALNTNLNTAALYNLILPTAPFQPTITELPPDFGVRPTYPSDFTVSPSSISFAATIIGESSPTQTVTITNSTANAIVINAVSLAGANPADFVYTVSPGTGCPSPLVSGATCTIPVSFQPTATGLRKAYFVIANTSVNPRLTVPLSGTGSAGTAGPISLSQYLINFNGYNVSTPVTLTNSGTTSLNIQGITFALSAGATGYYTETDNCGSVLPGQSICTINITAHPLLETNGAANMTIADDAATGSQTVALTYTPPGYSTEDMLDFGPVSIGNTAYGTFGITKAANNHDSTQGMYGSISGANSSDFSYSNGSLGSAGCVIVQSICMGSISFTPAALGERDAALSFPVGIIPVKGTGVGPGPYFVASAQSAIPYYQSTGYINFSPTHALQLSAVVGGSQEVMFNVRYTGTVSNPIMGPVITGPHASDFYGTTTCTGAPQTVCTVGLNFSPIAPASYTASGYIADSTDTYRQNFTVTVSTTGPGITVTPGDLTFPATSAGTISASQSVTAKAASNDPIQVTVSGPFQITQGATCPATPCQISIAFAPLSTASPGAAAGTLSLSDPATGDTNIVNLSGTTTVPTTVNISPGTIVFPLRPVNSTSIPQTITVTNTGTVNTLSFNSVSLIGANPTDYVLTDNCANPVGPGGSCTIDVSFAPTTPGTHTATLNIVSNSTTSPDQVSLSGTAQ